MAQSKVQRLGCVHQQSPDILTSSNTTLHIEVDVCTCVCVCVRVYGGVVVVDRGLLTGVLELLASGRGMASRSTSPPLDPTLVKE